MIHHELAGEIRRDRAGLQSEAETEARIDAEFPDSRRIGPPGLTVVAQRSRQAGTVAALGADQGEGEIEISRSEIDLLA